MKKSYFGMILISSVFGCFLIAGFLLVFVYNGMVDAGKGVEEAQGQIAAVCQRRLDLMPNLIETVKGYAKHEKQVLTAVTQARIQAGNILDRLPKEGLSAANLKALDMSQAQMSNAFRSIFALVENYPQLKASANFMALQDAFEGTENRISVTRQRYNNAVRNYNAKLEKFPGILIAPTFGFHKAEFFEAAPQAYAPVKAIF